MTTFEIFLEEREFPSNRVINTRREEFEPEVTTARDPDTDRVIWTRVEPYRLSVRPFIFEFDRGRGPGPLPGGFGPIPAPWGPGPPEELTTYTYLFTIWQGDWTREVNQTFQSPFPLHFYAYYIPWNLGIEADTVHTHAVSLRTLRVLDISPVSRYPDGIVSTAGGQQQVEARTPLRGVVGASEGIGETHFSEWTAWTTPAAIIDEPTTYADGLTTIERRMTLERNTVGRAVAFYRRFPRPPLDVSDPEEEPRVVLPFEEHILQVIERGDFTSIQQAIQDIDKRVERLTQLQTLLKERLEQTKR